ncbi:MAG: hypothetical protein KGM24_07790 [Elusimicrobia bacterium]|nr:hypothetical protein [Elusimicrobiota bacterium]
MAFRKLLAPAVLLAALAAAAPARAADPGLVADAMRDLQTDGPHWDERAVLAALLARPQESAAFDAEGRVALDDPQLRPLFIAEWRGKLVSFAAVESHHPDLALDGTYRNWADIMTPEMRAYTAQRVKSMTQSDRDNLIYYLNKVDEDLASNHGKVSTGLLSLTPRIVAGILDKYRQDLSAYAASSVAQNAPARGQAAAAQLASILSQRRAARLAAAQPPKKAPAPAKPAGTPSSAPAKTPVRTVRPPNRVAKAPTPSSPAKRPAPASGPASGPAAKTPAPPSEPTSPKVVAGPHGGALDQAKAAVGAGLGAGKVFDGGVNHGRPAGPVVVAPGTQPISKLPLLTPSAAPGVGGADLTLAPPPSPATSTDDLVSEISKMGSGKKPYSSVPLKVGVGGALLGGLLGFLLGGPIGALAGAALLGGAGYFAAGKILS